MTSSDPYTNDFLLRDLITSSAKHKITILHLISFLFPSNDSLLKQQKGFFRNKIKFIREIRSLDRTFRSFIESEIMNFTNKNKLESDGIFDKIKKLIEEHRPFSLLKQDHYSI